MRQSGRGGAGRPAAVAALAALTLLAAACSSTTREARSDSAVKTLQAAAAATAGAQSWTATLLPANVQVSYQAPDRYTQIEHGEEVSTSGGPSASTITKIYIGTVVYEADGPDGQPLSFDASQRCPGMNAAEYLLGTLREIAKSDRVRYSDGRYFFDIPKGANVPFPISGSATVRGGYVDGLSVNPGARAPQTFSIGSVNAAPPITAPPAAHLSSVQC